MLRTLFVLGILVPGLALAVRSRFAALLVYLWYSLFRPQEWIWHDITWMRLGLVTGVMVMVPWAWLATRKVQSEKQRIAARQALPNLTHPLSVGILLFFGAALYAQTGAVDPALGWKWLDYLWRVLLVSLITISLVDTRQRFIFATGAIALSLGFHAFKGGVMSTLRGGARIIDGLGGAYVDNNGYAMAIVMILFLLVAAAQNAPWKWLRLGLFAVVGPSALAVVYTFSRAGFLALTMAGLVFLLLQKRRVIALMALVPLVVGILLLLPSGYTDRIRTIQTYEEDEETSALSRLHFWRVALVMVEAHPYGVGLRNFDGAYDIYDFSYGQYGRRRSVHNSHLQVLAETGYFGFAVYTAEFALAFFLAFRVRARSKRGELDGDAQRFLFTSANALIVSMVGFLIGGSFIALALNDLTWITFGLVAALDRLSTRMLKGEAREDEFALPVEFALTPVRAPAPAVPAAAAFRGSYRAAPAEPPRRPFATGEGATS